MRNFINEDIIIDFKVPSILQESIDIAEKADDENNIGLYYIYADNIDVVAKNCYVDGALTKEQWNQLTKRYPQ